MEKGFKLSLQKKFYEPKVGRVIPSKDQRKDGKFYDVYPDWNQPCINISTLKETVDVSPKERQDTYSLEDGDTYAILLQNFTDTDADAVLSIDGKVVGTYRVLPGIPFRAERPEKDPRSFVFVREGSRKAEKAGVVSGGPESLNGVVECTFRPKKKPVKHSSYSDIEKELKAKFPTVPAPKYVYSPEELKDLESEKLQAPLVKDVEQKMKICDSKSSDNDCDENDSSCSSSSSFFDPVVSNNSGYNDTWVIENRNAEVSQQSLKGEYFTKSLTSQTYARGGEGGVAAIKNNNANGNVSALRAARNKLEKAYIAEQKVMAEAPTEKVRGATVLGPQTSQNFINLADFTDDEVDMQRVETHRFILYAKPEPSSDSFLKSKDNSYPYGTSSYLSSCSSYTSCFMTMSERERETNKITEKIETPRSFEYGNKPPQPQSKKIKTTANTTKEEKEDRLIEELLFGACSGTLNNKMIDDLLSESEGTCTEYESSGETSSGENEYDSPQKKEQEDDQEEKDDPRKYYHLIGRDYNDANEEMTRQGHPLYILYTTKNRMYSSSSSSTSPPSSFSSSSVQNNDTTATAETANPTVPYGFFQMGCGVEVPLQGHVGSTIKMVTPHTIFVEINPFTNKILVVHGTSRFVHGLLFQFGILDATSVSSIKKALEAEIERAKAENDTRLLKNASFRLFSVKMFEVHHYYYVNPCTTHRFDHLIGTPLSKAKADMLKNYFSNPKAPFGSFMHEIRVLKQTLPTELDISQKNPTRLNVNTENDVIVRIVGIF